MIALCFLRDLRSRGFKLGRAADGLAVEPASRLCDDDRRQLRLHRPEIIELLQAEEAEIRAHVERLLGGHPDAAIALEVALQMPDAALQAFRADVIEGRPWAKGAA